MRELAQPWFSQRIGRWCIASVASTFASDCYCWTRALLRSLYMCRFRKSALIGPSPTQGLRLSAGNASKFHIMSPSNMFHSRVSVALLDAFGFIPRRRVGGPDAFQLPVPEDPDIATVQDASPSWSGDLAAEVVGDRYIIGIAILIGYFRVFDMARCCRARRSARSAGRQSRDKATSAACRSPPGDHGRRYG